MKFRLVETTETWGGLFNQMSTHDVEAILTGLPDVDRNPNPGNYGAYISPAGDFFNFSESSIMHHDIVIDIAREFWGDGIVDKNDPMFDYIEDDDWTDEDYATDYFDVLAEDLIEYIECNLGWIRVNTGASMWEERTYVCINKNKRPTKLQYIALEEWFDNLLKIKKAEVQVIAQGSQLDYDDAGIFNVYKYSGKQLVQAIQNFYSSGVMTVTEAYHWGDLDIARKADKRGIMAGRGTGHFGTGFYLVGSPKEVSGYKERALWEIDLSKYKLYKPYTNSFAYDLHDALKGLNQLFFRYKYNDYGEWIFHTNRRDLYKKLDDATYDFDDEGYMVYCKENRPELVDEVQAAIDEGKWGAVENIILNDMDEIQEWLDLYRNVKLRLTATFITEDEDFVISTIQRLIVDEELDDADNVDSISTLFIKALGYEGIDVTHLNKDADGLSGLDNFTYGSVVYDLKPGTYWKIRDKAA